ncbi:MAG TPA: SDR family NAD(P)-dependent oxidoreductase [Chloroflexota bacterium]
MNRLQDKVCLITGAGSGIGEASALLFAREGAPVAVVDIDEASAQRTVDHIRSEGGEAEARRVDVADAADTQACARWASTAGVASTCCSTTPASAVSATCLKPTRTSSIGSWPSMSAACT